MSFLQTVFGLGGKRSADSDEGPRKAARTVQSHPSQATAWRLYARFVVTDTTSSAVQRHIFRSAQQSFAYHSDNSVAFDDVTSFVHIDLFFADHTHALDFENRILLSTPGGAQNWTSTVTHTALNAPLSNRVLLPPQTETINDEVLDNEALSAGLLNAHLPVFWYDLGNGGQVGRLAVTKPIACLMSADVPALSFCCAEENIPGQDEDHPQKVLLQAVFATSELASAYLPLLRNATVTGCPTVLQIPLWRCRARSFVVEHLNPHHLRQVQRSASLSCPEDSAVGELSHIATLNLESEGDDGVREEGGEREAGGGGDGDGAADAVHSVHAKGVSLGVAGESWVCDCCELEKTRSMKKYKCSHDGCGVTMCSKCGH